MKAVRLLVCACLGAALVTLPACGATSQTNAQIASAELSAGLKAQALGKTSEAADHYHNVLAHDPNNKFAYYNLGLIDQQAGRTSQAENEYRAALTSDPNFVEALFNLAIIRTGPDPTEAIQLYTKAIQLKPDWGAAHLNLAFLLQQTGQRTQAAAEFAAAVKLDPSLASRIPSPSPSPSPHH